MAPVAVAVVSWNTRDLLAGCLDSLAPEHEAGRAEVWVVDNASTDGSAELVRERYPWANLIAREDNLGFGRAVNLVAREATGWDWIAPANADIALEPGALAELLRAGDADRGAGALAPRLILPDGSTQHSVFPFPTLPFTAAFNVRLRLDRWPVEGHWDPAVARRVPWAFGAFLLVRRGAWEAVGGFDEEQFMYAEDLDLGWRLARAEWATRYVPGARVKHVGGAATAQAWSDAAIRKQRETYAWMRRRRGGARTTGAAAINVAGAATGYAARALAARVRPQRFGWARDQWRGYLEQHVEGYRSGRT